MRIASPWIETAPSPGWAPLAGDLTVDVCVLGAGITGVSVARLLADAGKTVAVLEMDEVGKGVTGYTTAKVSALHGTAYSELRSKHSDEAVAVYGAANVAGLERLLGWVDELGIDCDLRRKPNYTYAADEDELSTIEDEVEATQVGGLATSFTTETDLPWEVAGAVRLGDQAEFHPRKYLLGLAAGLQIYEGTRAMSVDEGSPCSVRTDSGATVTAEHVVVATHFPILDRGMFFARMTPQRSYAIGIRVAGEPPQGMYISAGSTTRSVRSHPLDGELVIVGGEGHKTAQTSSHIERYETLEAFARSHWDVEEVPYRWSSQDCQPADGLPYVGGIRPGSEHVLTATGYRKWGFTNGTAAALILADRILGRENEWAETLNSNRMTLSSVPTILKENANVGWHFFADNVKSPKSPRCTHLGCKLLFNDAERTWDCPCHGSRFSEAGKVIEGPAVRDLDPDDLPASSG